MARRDKETPESPADETTLPQPASTDPVPETAGTPAPAQQEPGFFAQRNPKVSHPRGKDRRVATYERRNPVDQRK